MNVGAVALMNRDTRENSGGFSLSKLLLGYGALFSFAATSLRQKLCQRQQHIPACFAGASRLTPFISAGDDFEDW
jgi:hypothetical protein